MINNSRFTDSFIDSGCLCYAAFDESLVTRMRLPRIAIRKRQLKLAKNDEERRVISEITYAEVDIDGHRERVFGYVIKGLAYPIILGDPWMRSNDVVYMARQRKLRIGSKKHGIIVREKGWETHGGFREGLNHIRSGKVVIGAAFLAEVRRMRKSGSNTTQVVAVSMADINKALEKLEKKKYQTKIDIAAKLPREIRDLGNILRTTKADRCHPTALARTTRSNS